MISGHKNGDSQYQASSIGMPETRLKTAQMQNAPSQNLRRTFFGNHFHDAHHNRHGYLIGS